MSTRWIFVAMVAVTLMASGCNAPTPAPPTVTPWVLHVTKEPIPPGVQVGGAIFGLPPGTIASISAVSDKSTSGGGGNQSWDLALSPLGDRYVVTAQAEGYVSSPVSYTVRIVGDKAYVVEGGQTIDKQADHLDFTFHR